MAKRASTVEQDGEARLRRKLRGVFRSKSRFSSAVGTIEEWNRLGWEPVLFGGFLRDLYVFGRREFPRDVDVVIRNKNNSEMEPELRAWIKRRTSLGGFHLQKGFWNFDVWGLGNTAAFQRHPSLFVEIADLPKTTFLDVEAVAVHMLPGGSPGQIFQEGFFSAIKAEKVDLNWEENANPALAAVRGLAVALKLNFSIGNKLARYITTVVDNVGLRALLEAQVRHYGTIKIGSAMLENLVNTLRLHEGSSSVPVHMARSQQLHLWPDYNGVSSR